MNIDAGSQREDRLNLALFFLTIVVLIWSGIGPRDRLTWVLEVVPVVLAAIILVKSYGRFRFTRLAYVLVFIHCVILCIGAHWTYSHVPAGDWLKSACDLSRNHYDRLGHFAQGFVPAILAREVFLRTTPLVRGGWLFFLVTATCLAISAAFELNEWAAAMILGGDADEYLAMQGDEWDTQWDMFLALCGAILSQATLRVVHDRQLRARELG